MTLNNIQRLFGIILKKLLFHGKDVTNKDIIESWHKGMCEIPQYADLIELCCNGVKKTRASRILAELQAIDLNPTNLGIAKEQQVPTPPEQRTLTLAERIKNLQPPTPPPRLKYTPRYERADRATEAARVRDFLEV
jgi:hypothetical protein